MRVVEIINKRTLAGEEVKYMLQAGPGDEANTVMLDQIDGEVFDSPDKVRSTLIQRATTQVNKLTDLAISKSKEWYGQASSKQQETQQIQQQPAEQDDNAQIVQLPDGTLAKIRLPDMS